MGEKRTRFRLSFGAFLVAATMLLAIFVAVLALLARELQTDAAWNEFARLGGERAVGSSCLGLVVLVLGLAVLFLATNLRRKDHAGAADLGRSGCLVARPVHPWFGGAAIAALLLGTLVALGVGGRIGAYACLAGLVVPLMLALAGAAALRGSPAHTDDGRQAANQRREE